MKKAALIVNILFIVLTFVGVALAICCDFNPANAVIPAVFALISGLLCQSK